MQNIYSVALTGHIFTVLTCRRIKSILCLSAVWLLPAQHFSESGDGQQRKALVWHKAAPGPSRTFPVARPLLGKPSSSWLMTTVLWHEWNRPLYLPSQCLDWRLTLTDNSSGMTQDLWLCWVVVITSLFLLRDRKSFSLCRATVHIPLIKCNSIETRTYLYIFN